MAWGETQAWLAGEENAPLYDGLLREAAQAAVRDAGRRKILKPSDMPWEMSPQGSSSTS